MLNTNDTLVIGIDIQEKLVNMLKNSETIATNATKLLSACNILNVQTILTEQYPKGLGNTINSIKEIKDFKTLEKTSFSALRTEEIEKELKNYDFKNVVIFGIETHICVYQTVLDLLKEKYNVYVVADCSSSRADFNHNTALELMKQKGAYVTSLEIVLFEWLKSSKHENFKAVQGLIK